ncbi:hypothetical protein ABM016_18645 [Morganella morganii]|uniref:hypothetical protein n=1 Tax=Morganella morganii TaxID=582 RepID=UPI003EC0E65B
MNSSSFLTKLAFILFILAVTFGVAGFAAWKYWNFMFELLGYNTTDFLKLNAENQAMKTPLNLTMYSMPVNLWCISAGFFVSSGVACFAEICGEIKSFILRIRGRKTASQL